MQHQAETQEKCLATSTSQEIFSVFMIHNYVLIEYLKKNACIILLDARTDCACFLFLFSPLFTMQPLNHQPSPHCSCKVWIPSYYLLSSFLFSIC